MSDSAKRSAWLLCLGVVVATAAILLFMGREPICKCGFVKLWHGETMSAENSQHIFDWYTPSHIIHGFIFFGVLWVFAKRWSFGVRLALALVIEGAWEIFENTDFVINRYRETTIALDYYGDSVVNSVSDLASMAAGFYAAARLNWKIILFAAIILELVVGAIIRDNLTLNVVMLIWPVEAIKAWQSGG